MAKSTANSDPTTLHSPRISQRVPLDVFTGFQQGVEKNEVRQPQALEWALECWRLLGHPRPSELKALMTAGLPEKNTPKSTRNR